MKPMCGGAVTVVIEVFDAVDAGRLADTLPDIYLRAIGSGRPAPCDSFRPKSTVASGSAHPLAITLARRLAGRAVVAALRRQVVNPRRKAMSAGALARILAPLRSSA